ncbi:hypothetical protein [Methanogenium cariaci]|jgi:hypothetical protein
MKIDLAVIEPDPRMRQLIFRLFVVMCASFVAAAVFGIIGI